MYYNGGAYLVQAYGVEEKIISIIKEQQKTFTLTNNGHQIIMYFKPPLEENLYE